MVVHTHTNTNTHTYTHKHTHTHTQTQTHMNTYVYTCIYSTVCEWWNNDSSKYRATFKIHKHALKIVQNYNFKLLKKIAFHGKFPVRFKIFLENQMLQSI